MPALRPLTGPLRRSQSAALQWSFGSGGCHSAPMSEPLRTRYHTAEGRLLLAGETPIRTRHLSYRGTALFGPRQRRDARQMPVSACHHAPIRFCGLSCVGRAEAGSSRPLHLLLELRKRVQVFVVPVFWTVFLREAWAWCWGTEKTPRRVLLVLPYRSGARSSLCPFERPKNSL